MNRPHTPSPWRHGVSYPDGIDIIKDEAHPTHQPYWTVCKINTCMGSESEANAKLIAAAPDLLEQLTQLATSYAYWLPRYGDPEAVNSQLMQNVRAAIAKATT